MSKKTPSQRSMAHLRSLGYTCQVVEKWIPGANMRKDLFDFGDICAYRPGEIVLVQTTSATNFSARKKKILASPHFKGWLESGGRVFLHGWNGNKMREEELSAIHTSVHLTQQT